MSKILIVEDDLSLQRLLQYDIEKAGYETELLNDGSLVFDFVQKNPIDVVILDMMLPGQNGIEVCKQIRKINQDIYIILLTAINDEFTKLDAFDAGADDYITKPFSIREVLARISVGIKRSTSSVKCKNIDFLHINIDTKKRKVFSHDKQVELTYTEFELLKFFIQNADQVFSRDELLERIWGYDYIGETRTVDVYCHKLRDKLDLSENLVTVRGVGYMLKV